MDYSKMSDIDISREVAKALNLPWTFNGTSMIFVADGSAIGRHDFDPCNNPADAWPIIVENGISIVRYENEAWLASSEAYWVDGVEWQIDGEVHQNPLRAAMIAFLKVKESANVQTDSTR